MTAGDDDGVEVTVLIADADVFEADYVSTVLKARGIRIVGPLSEPSLVFDIVGTPGLQAAVIASDNDHVGGAELVAELDRAGIPYLTLLRAARRNTVTAKPVLTPPFAAYQVADWVLETLAYRSRTTCQQA